MIDTFSLIIRNVTTRFMYLWCWWKECHIRQMVRCVWTLTLFDWYNLFNPESTMISKDEFLLANKLKSNSYDKAYFKLKCSHCVWGTIFNPHSIFIFCHIRLTQKCPFSIHILWKISNRYTETSMKLHDIPGITHLSIMFVCLIMRKNVMWCRR